MSSKKLLNIAGKFLSADFRRSFLLDLKEAIAGTEKDFTAISLSRSIFLLSVPMILETIMESVFAIVDIFFVSKLGADAIASVGITESLITLVYAISAGLSMATAAIVSRRIGEKKASKASKSASQAILTGFFISLLISISGIFFSKDLLRLMGAESDLIANYSSYTAIILGSNTVIMMLFVINAIFRSAGDAAISMRVLWMANIINIILDPILIFGLGPIPALGIKGAAIATTTGRSIAVIYQFYLLFKGRGRIKLVLADFIPDFKLIFKIIGLSLGGIGQTLIATSSWVILMRIVAKFGSEVIAGYTIAIRLIIFSLLPSWGLSNAAATLVGQNLGAKQPDRAERSVMFTGYANMIMLGFFGLLYILWPSFFIHLFIKDAEVIKNGSIALRIVSYGFLAYGFGMVMVQAFNGSGDTKTPTILNFICFWMLEIPLAYFLALNLELGQKGVYFSIVIAESILAILSFLVFRRGKWKSNQV